MMKVGFAGAVVVGMLAGCAAVGSDTRECCTLEVDVVENAPVTLRVALDEATAVGGARATVRISNTGESPYVLKVCPAMKLCCIKGMHVTLGSEETGMSLIDVCTVSNPERHETFLPIGATFEFVMSIPAEYLPQGANKRGQKLALQLCMELADGGQLLSEPKSIQLN